MQTQSQVKRERPDVVSDIQPLKAEIQRRKESIDRWNIFTVICVILAFVAAGGLALAAIILKNKNDRLDTAQTELASLTEQQYAADSKAKDLEIAKANERAEDAKKEGIEAGKNAGNAILRAAELEKEAAAARLETEKIKEVVAWRVLPAEAASELEKFLAASPGSVNLRYTDGDPEALYLAGQIAQILYQAHWKVAPASLKISNAIVFGIAIPDANGADAENLRRAFSAAKISYSTNPLPTGASEMTGLTTPGAPTLMVGSRMPPKLP